ncbi:hypothetical protein O181_080311 [Austropuccinia psidii MF-1]|uniref:Uncharacterized protein n=1 Tax=Austropuccinia psidii MF-1 TaxID=1389203 RepID=A0A9Q3IEU2_9BASI|nr:hypothetical protein [Austropuccinia psidii MF-1]
MVQEVRTVDEAGPSLSEVVDENHPDMPCDSSTVTPSQEGEDVAVDESRHPAPEIEVCEGQRIRVIRPCHPMLVSSDINPENVCKVWI